MNIPLLFFIFLAIAIVGFIVAAINMLIAAKRVFRSGIFDTKNNTILVHIIAGLCYVLGGIGAIGFGIAWIVTYFKH